MIKMSFFDRVKGFFSQNSQVLVDTGIESTRSDLRAAMTGWLYNAPYGQPRGVNLTRIRELARSPFISLCISTIIDTFATTPWHIVPKEKENYNESHIEELTQFLMKPNRNKETLTDIMRQWARDLLEIDAAILVKVFTSDSYEGEYDSERKEYIKKSATITLEKKTERGIKKVKKSFHPLKPRGQRKLVEIYCRDAATFLPQGSWTGIIERWFQYSWKMPLREPLMFDRDEIVYTVRNPRSYSFYGWSPIQAIEDIVITLKSQLTYFEGFFRENGIPSGVLSILDTNTEELKRLKDYWRKEMTGRRHNIPFIGRKVEYVPMSITSRDMEVLSTQQWFMKLVMAHYNLNIPILSLRGEAPRAGTEAMIQREMFKAVKPLLDLFQYEINAEVLSEFGYDDVEFKFEAYDVDYDRKIKEIEWNDLRNGVLTVNEVRKKRGLDDVEWGDYPFNINAGISPFQPKMKYKEVPKLPKISPMMSFEEFKKSLEEGFR